MTPVKQDSTHSKSFITMESEVFYMNSEKGRKVMADEPPTRRNRHLAIGFLSVACCYLLFSSMSFGTLTSWIAQESHANRQSDLWQAPITAKALVPLEAHIMSKCPDARDCLMDLILPTMQRSLDKVNFTLSYIGTPTDNDGVACMHGPEECMGNIIELCAANMYPDPKIYLGFTMCLTRDYKDIPQRSLVEDCALEHAVDFAKLNECAVRDDGGFGMGMLRDSIRRSKDAGVTSSCTVRLDEKIYCIRDGGEWKDCPNGPGVNDLVIAIEKLYQSS